MCGPGRMLAIFATLAAVVTAEAQNNAIAWSRNVEQSVALAKRTRRPMMFWVLGGSSSRDHDLERDQKRAFADPSVAELSRRFVTVRISRSVHREQLDAWGLSPRTNLEIVFTTPDGEKIDTLSGGGVREPEAFARKMSLVFQSYRSKIFETELKEKMEAAETPESELRAALDLIADFTILSAATTTVKLLDRDDLSESTRGKVYDTLAILSTPATVDALLENAPTDPLAAKALSDCTPDAAETMLRELGGDDPEMHLIVYHAVTQICKIRDVKPDKFWNGEIRSLREKEIERVKRIVSETARRWRERYDEYR